MRSKEQFYLPDEDGVRMGLSIWHEREKEYEKNRRGFLQWVENTYHPQKIYYPGSGKDRLPKEVLGENRVVHLSLEENKEIGGYFLRLGSGQKVEGDFLRSPFKDESFDAVFVHDTPIGVTTQGTAEFYRVLKEGGVLVLDNGNWDDRELQRFLHIVQELLRQQQLPKEFNDPEKLLASVDDWPTPHGGRHIGLATSEKQIKRLLKNIPPHRQKVVRQFFAVFKKQ